jgi:hypothetical protein
VTRTLRHTLKDPSRRRVWVYVAVAVFVLADIALVGVALNSTRSDAASTVAVVRPAVVAPVGTPTATPALTPIPPTRILSALDATTAWRAQTGVCPAASASPELTTDSGITWKKTDASGPTQVTALQRITVTSQSAATMVGFAKVDCAPELVRTFVGGDSFRSYPDQLDAAWYVYPGDRAAVHSPIGAAKAPCAAVVVLAPRDAKNAAVLCGNGEVYATADAAVTWSDPVAAPGALNITSTNSGYLAATVGRSECAGIQLLSLSTDLASTPTGCYPVVEPVKTLVGTVAVSSAAGTIWLWAGNSVVRSLDGGATWN